MSVRAAVAMMVSAISRARSNVSMNAPEPVLTSITMYSVPAAVFFDRIEAVISGTDSTVLVTSRIA